MPYRTIVTGGTIVTDVDQFAADIVIDDDRISAIVADASEMNPDHVIDASHLLVLPGAIDTRVSFFERAGDDREGFESGGRAAAAGGVTTVIETPIATPIATTAGGLRARIEAIGREAIVDTAVWAGIAESSSFSTAEFGRLGALAPVGFCGAMHASFDGFPRLTDHDVLAAMIDLGSTNVPVAIAAEHGDLLKAFRTTMRADGRTDPDAHAEVRAPIAESAAVNTALFLAEQTGCWVHLTGVSLGESARLIGDARARHLRVTAETSPHFLALSDADLDRLGGFARTAPALRHANEIDMLWAAVLDETIDLISSDHVASIAADHKVDDIFDAPLGVPGVQTMLPLFWDEAVNKRGMSHHQFVRQTSANAARIFGIFPRKGTIRVGADADLVLFDPDGEWTIHDADMLQRHRWSPFNNRRVRGFVVRTIRRGATIYDGERHDDVSLAAPGSGRFIPRGYGQN